MDSADHDVRVASYLRRSKGGVMGTFERTFNVDGASYDLFRHDEDEDTFEHLIGCSANPPR
jgi:hypothetical protein